MLVVSLIHFNKLVVWSLKQFSNNLIDLIMSSSYLLIT